MVRGGNGEPEGDLQFTTILEPPIDYLHDRSPAFANDRH